MPTDTQKVVSKIVRTEAQIDNLKNESDVPQIIVDLVEMAIEHVDSVVVFQRDNFWSVQIEASNAR